MGRTGEHLYASMGELGGRFRCNAHILSGVRVGEVVGGGMVLRVVLELLGRDGGAEEVLQVLEDVLL